MGEAVVEGREMERVYDVDDTVFVAVGNNVDESKTTLLWALHSFSGCKFCLLHVHQPPKSSPPSVNSLNGETEVEAVEELDDVLRNYCFILEQEGMVCDNVWIEMDSIEEGIVEIIARYNVRWLVMGAAADTYYSEEMTELKSKKAMFVCQSAPFSCHIWFACEGHLIYTREGWYDYHETDHALPLLLPYSDLRIEQKENWGSEYAADDKEDSEELEGNLDKFEDQCTLYPMSSIDTVLSTSSSVPLLTDWEENDEGQIIEAIHTPDQPCIDAEDLKQIVYEEAGKRWEEEDYAMEASCKAEVLKSLCIKEMTIRKEMEEELAKLMQEVERMKNQRDEVKRKLQMIWGQTLGLECQVAESHHMETELEEKIISAVELLITFKERRDAARVDYQKASREVGRLRKSANDEDLSFCKSEILEFSFMEINNATNYFDPSHKIGEGRFGSVYKGVLRHVDVAIKMLPPYGSQSQSKFRKGVEVLSRVRHPNLVTLIGICPESRSLVHEYLRNGSLEDRLACKDKNHPLPWQTRTSIAIDISRALIFLHSNNRCIIHGNLKPSKVLLDANFVCKLSDYGILNLFSKPENSENTDPACKKSETNFPSAYMDPEYLETGILTPESDVYSLGIILLQLLTGRSPVGIVKNVDCALENGNLEALLDSSAGDWPLEQATQLTLLGLRCCEKNSANRPDIVSDIWSILQPMRALCHGPAIVSSSKRSQQRAPSHFVCPIYQEVMEDPHIAADGFTYEGEAIKGWLQSGHSTSPMTNLKLDDCNLLPNHALFLAIQEWQQNC